MEQEAVCIYDVGGKFIGYAIRRVDAPLKLASVNIYMQNEVKELNHTIRRANDEGAMRAHWPSTSDPEVGKELEKIPVEYEDQEVIDEANSNIVTTWDPIQQMDVINYNESDITYKTLSLPVSSGAIQRLDKACETVARRRAGLDA